MGAWSATSVRATRTSRLKRLAPGLIALALAGCDLPYGNSSVPIPSPSPSVAISPSACIHLEPAVGFPNDVGVVRDSANGKTFCIRVGQAVVVILEAPADNVDTEQWQAMASSDPTVAVSEPGADTAPIRGETRRVVKGLKPGVALLTSTRPPCSSDSPAQCPADQGWQSIVVVSP